MATEIRKIKKTTVVEHAMEQIKELIASGQYGVGQKLPTEQELAQRFSIARSSVREAVKIFNYLGVLESRTGRGTYVCDRGRISTEALTWSVLLGQEELYELIGLRGVLERAGLEALADPRRAADRDRTIAALQKELKSMRQSVAVRDVEGRIAADYGFHGAIIGASGNGVFVGIYRTLRSFMYDEIRKTLQQEDAQEAVREHEALLRAIRAGNQAAAQRMLGDHIRSITRRLQGQKAAVPGIDRRRSRSHNSSIARLSDKRSQET